MTPQQINRAIAEALGWKLIHKGLNSRGEVIRLYDNGEETARVVEGWINELPNYSSDLNAIHEAEGALDSVVLIKSYFYHLTSQADPEYATEHLVRASAADRAEAFLRTIGKWEDGE